MAPCDALWDGDARILMYHGITTCAAFDGVTNYYRYNVPATEFAEQLAFLHEHCNVISLASLRTAAGLSRTKANVVLSFDDGYENNYTVAFPLLKRYGMPAVFALPTAFVCDREPLWNDAVEYAVNHSAKERVSFTWDGPPREFSLTDATGRVSLNKWLLDELVRVEQGRRDELASIAIDTLGVTAAGHDLFRHEDYRPLTPEQISELAASGSIEFASHSIHHYLLSKLDAAARRIELRESKRQIERVTGRPCTALCMPGGAYDDDVLRDAFSSGYEVVLTSKTGRAVPGAGVLNRNVVRHRVSMEKFAEVVHRAR